MHALDHRSDLIGILRARLTGRPVLASFLGWVNFPRGSWRATVYPWIDRMILRRLDAVIMGIADAVRSMRDAMDRGRATK